MAHATEGTFARPKSAGADGSSISKPNTPDGKVTGTTNESPVPPCWVAETSTGLSLTNDCQSVVPSGIAATFMRLGEGVNAPVISTDWPGAFSLDIQKMELLVYVGVCMSQGSVVGLTST